MSVRVCDRWWPSRPAAVLCDLQLASTQAVTAQWYLQIKSVRKGVSDDEDVADSKAGGKKGKMYEKKIKKGKKRQSNPSKGAGGVRKKKSM